MSNIAQARTDDGTESRPSSRGRTRALLLDAAEELFARRGVDAVPLREIAAAAGQRNNAAVYYHFGDKQGLIDALIADRMGRVEQARQALIERSGDLSGLNVEGLLTVLWQPMLELGHWKSVHWFIQFRLASQLRGDSATPASYSDDHPASRQIHDALHALHPHLPPALFDYRMNLIAMMFWSAVSWHDSAALAANQTWSTRFSMDQILKVAAAALVTPA